MESQEPGVNLPEKMPLLDRLLPVWILTAMIVGLLIGRFIPGVGGVLGAMEVGGISIPIAAGLLVMMYPPLAKVRYDKAVAIAADARLMGTSLILNWIVGPLFMFSLAWMFLSDEPELRTGLIIVALARCIAMVFVWSDLSCGDREATAVLVAINAVFQVLMFAVLGWFYLRILPAWLGLDTESVEFSFSTIAASVVIFLGLPLLAGAVSRLAGERAKGRDWYEGAFLQDFSFGPSRSALYHFLVICLAGKAGGGQPVGRGSSGIAFGALFPWDVCPGPRRCQGGGNGLCAVYVGGVYRCG